MSEKVNNEAIALASLRYLSQYAMPTVFDQHAARVELHIEALGADLAVAIARAERAEAAVAELRNRAKRAVSLALRAHTVDGPSLAEIAEFLDDAAGGDAR